MNRIVAHAVVSVLLLAAPTATYAGETGMSHDDTVNPGAPLPHIAPPGGSTSPQPLSTNTTPRTGATPLPSGLPPREVQPGEETPQTEDELYVGRKAGGGSVSSGDEDEFEDLDIERRTVQGAEKPGAPSKRPSAGPGGQGVGLPPRRKEGPMARGAPTPGAPAPGADVTASKRGPNCGTFWTTRVEDPEVNVNPCPKNCTRGERQLVNTYKQGNKTLYDARYQCYQMATVPQSKGGAALTPDNSPPARARAVIEKPAAVPAGTVTPASGPWGIFARLKGSRFASADSVRALWYPNNDTTKAPTLSASVTIRGRHGPDEIAIQIPLDPAKSGGVGNFSSGPLHILLFMPDEKTVIYAGRYTVDTGIARKDLRKAVGAEVAVKPTTSTAGTAQPAGSGEPRLVTGGTQGVQVAGGETASTQSGIGGAPRELNRPAAADREVSTRNIVPGPTLLAVTDVTATTLTLKWKPLAGAGGYTLHAAAKGLNHSVTGPEVKQPASMSNDLSAPLSGLVPGVEHSVWVTVNYPDGKRGSSDPKNVTTAAAENPKGLKTSAIGPGAIRLEWEASPGASHYLVQGSNLQRTQTTNTAVAVSNLAAATHEWSVIAVYPPGVYNDLNPSRVSATVAADVSGRARYRITINGFRVDQETMDDPLQRDGKGDEVYFALRVEEYDRTNLTRSGHALVKSPVFGDKNGFPAQSRVMAGRAGESGGLRRGDLYPGANPVTRSREPSSIDLPLFVWDGYLEAGKSALLIYPAIWEWDGEQAGERFSHWLGDFNNDGFANTYGAIKRDSVIQQFTADRVNVLTLDAAAHATGATWINITNSELSGDRPIGFSQVRSALESIFTLGSYTYFERVIVLTREAIERELAARNTSSLPPGIVAIRYRDDPAADGTFGGDYTLYLQVERLP
ncbi:MAG: hypothetical protein NUV55_11405 [Sulfuricaulis sp.]|uniref:hypothetical protein n=1 Tax=Sulfuricaulis sp. TaxID=2003553 RepID=UPI0025FCCA3F|nr:hypothetical protein [Sulfuricaulis sp.]MCR4347790.1 hypothetical protein [Sulfuricaulis sp.]